jgi:hypothetical protein
MEDHMQNGILHLNSILTTLTTKMLHLVYVYNPPKRISKFENLFLAAILTNTLQAGFIFEPILKFLTWTWSNLTLSALLDTLSTLQHQCHLLSPLHLTKIDHTLPCRGMACPLHAIFSPGRL